MVLTEHDRISETWRKLAEHLNEQLVKAHKANEKSISIEDTATLRGRIKLLRELIKLGNEQPTSAATSN